MQLVKDIFDTRVVFYWSSADKPISPIFHQMDLARDWLVGKIWHRYSGAERRKVVRDRRRDARSSEDFSSQFNLKRERPKGRRATDLIEVKVDVDLCWSRVQSALDVG